MNPPSDQPTYETLYTRLQAIVARLEVGELPLAESLALYEAAIAGDLETALAIYRWFMPLLHLDAEHDLVQSIKLAEQIMGRGSERVRPPRLPLAGARRAQVTAMVEAAAASRPALPQAA